MQKRIWITWETQRRSVELSKKFGCDLFIVEHVGIMRYLKCIWNTYNILRKNNPDLLFVQNPSMILAAMACIYKMLTGKPVVVDRHTTFRLNKKDTFTPYNIAHKIFNYFTLNKADLTIVTNAFLAQLVKNIGGNPFILPDMMPMLKEKESIQFNKKYNILLISSFASDEPIGEVFEAMKVIHNEDVCLYITGNSEKLTNDLAQSVPSNIILTGFLSEQRFVDMLFSVDAIMVLTTADCTMLCGCYEALAAGKPLITSDKDVLREYFYGAVFVDNSVSGLADGIHKVIEKLDVHKKNTCEMRDKLKIEWDNKYDELEKLLNTLPISGREKA